MLSVNLCILIPNIHIRYNYVIIIYRSELTAIYRYKFKKIICLDVFKNVIFCKKIDIICCVNHLISYKINKITKNDYVGILKHKLL